MRSGLRGATVRAVTALLVGVLVAGCGSDASSRHGDPGSSAAAGDQVGSAAFPGPTNTGVPRGTRLSRYLGDCTISSDNTTITGKLVDCDLVIRAANVTIVSSRITGRVELDPDAAGSRNWSVMLRDSEVDAGTVQRAAVGYGNLTVLRSNVYGGQASVQCGQRSAFCVVRDSWLHGQRVPADADWHLNGFLSNGGSDVELTHNTVVCDATPNKVDGGCTSNISLLGDFAPVSRVNVTRNFLGANPGSAYCTYGGDVVGKKFPNADHVVYRDNVFERGGTRRCAAYGPVTAFDPTGKGNIWTNNRWDEGGLVRPAL